MFKTNTYQALVGAAALATLSMMADAKPMDDAPKSAADTELFIVDARLRDVVDVLGRVTGERIELTDAVSGRVTRKRLAGSLENILATLAEDYDFDWFAFNGQYYVSLRREATSRVIRLGFLDIARARAALAAAGLAGDGLRVMESENGEYIVLTGPPRIVAFSEVIVESLADPTDPAPGGTGIRVYRGTTASFGPVSASSSATSEPVSEPDAAEVAQATDPTTQSEADQ